MSGLPTADRRIDIPGTTNLRDVGGYPVADGRVVAEGRLLRGEVIVDAGTPANQGVWEPAQAHRFIALRLRTVIDLRAEREARSAPSAWARATGADVVSLAITEGGEGADTTVMRQLLSGELRRFGEQDMAELYRDTLDRRAGAFGRAIAVLAAPDRLPALVHCSAGKDRTGLLVALVLEVLGVPREVTVADYALTGVLRPNRVEAFAERFAASQVPLDDVRTLFETPAGAMQAALAHLDTRHGGAAAYLSDAGGLDDGILRDLRDALLVDSGSGS